MLDLSDPLWNELSTAYGANDVAGALRVLYEEWDDNVGRELFWDHLYHQSTLYESTYAAIPHLLIIENNLRDETPRLEIALFCAAVAKCAHRKIYSAPPADSQFSGLNVGADRRLLKIESDFAECLPRIFDLCRQLLSKGAQGRHRDDEVGYYLLAGMAAALGRVSLADFIESVVGRGGGFRCSDCRKPIEWVRFDARLAIYSRNEGILAIGPRDPVRLDMKAGMPTRASGFLSPATDDSALMDDEVMGRLLHVAREARRPDLVAVLRYFVGSCKCPHCGTVITPSNNDQSAGC